MLWYTHLMAGAVAGVLAGDQLGIKAVLAGTVVSGLASLLPDIDSPKSVAGRSAPVLSWGARIAVGHRGLLHSLLAASAVSLLLSAVPFLRCYSWFFFWGYVSHLLLDALNPEGVPLLWPLPLRVSVPLAETGGLLERFVLRPLLVVVFCVAAVIHLF